MLRAVRRVLGRSPSNPPSSVGTGVQSDFLQVIRFVATFAFLLALPLFDLWLDAGRRGYVGMHPLVAAVACACRAEWGACYENVKRRKRKK